MLRDAWTHFIRLMSGGNDPVTSLDDIDFDEVYGEESIILNTIVRILNYIVVVSPHTRLIHFCFRLAASETSRSDREWRTSIHNRPFGHCFHNQQPSSVNEQEEHNASRIVHRFAPFDSTDPIQ